MRLPPCLFAVSLKSETDITCRKTTVRKAIRDMWRMGEPDRKTTVRKGFRGKWRQGGMAPGVVVMPAAAAGDL